MDVVESSTAWTSVNKSPNFHRTKGGLTWEKGAPLKVPVSSKSQRCRFFTRTSHQSPAKLPAPLKVQVRKVHLYAPRKDGFKGAPLSKVHLPRCTFRRPSMKGAPLKVHLYKVHLSPHARMNFEPSPSGLKGAPFKGAPFCPSKDAP